MKRSFFFDTAATDNAGGSQEPTEQLNDTAAVENAESAETDAEGEAEGDGGSDDE